MLAREEGSARLLGLVVVVVLGITVLVGTTIGGRYDVAPPVLLILLGCLLGLIPSLGDIELEPDVVLLLFLPAILYWESLNSSIREIRANLRVIVLSSVALVVVSMVVVSYVAQWLGVDSDAAWVLGAVLAPTDAAAVAGLAKRMPRRMLTTLRAESLINDGTALVLFAVALSVAVGGHRPGALELVGRFVGSYAGGIAAGVLTAVVIIFVRRRLDDPLREGGLSVLTPFLAFLAAEVVHASGVVAVVVCGLILARFGPTLIRARSRVQSSLFWDLGTFLLNGGLFVLLGMQVPRAVRDISGTSTSRAVVIGLAVTAAVVLTRLAWVHVVTVLVRTLDRRPVQRTRRVGWRIRSASGWAGFRGAVSLAAALAVPVTTDAGTAFPDRDLIVFLTSMVIVVTMLVQGTTLPAVIRWAHLPEDTARTEEVEMAQREAAQAGLAALPDVASSLGIDGPLLDRAQDEYREHAAAVGATDGDGGDAAATTDLYRKLRLGVLEHKRLTVVRLRDEQRIDDIVLRQLQAAMDLEELRLLGPAPQD